MHHDSRSWVHWTQQKFEEDQSFTCMVFREGLSMHSHCQGQGAMWNSQQELGPSHQPGKGADRLGGSESTPTPQPGVFVVTQQVWGTAGKSASQSQVTVRQRWDKAGDKVNYHLYGDSPEDWAEMGSTLMPFILHWALHKTRQLDNSKAVYYPNILELKVLKRMNSIACHAGSYCSVCVHSTQQVWKCRFYDIPCSSVTNHSADLDSMQILKNLGCSY